MLISFLVPKLSFSTISDGYFVSFFVVEGDFSFRIFPNPKESLVLIKLYLLLGIISEIDFVALVLLVI